MIESIMWLGIGFLAACLLMLSLAPLVHARAVRLTTRRHRDATPASVIEMRAEKDGMRAQFAMSVRRLEIMVEETRAKATYQLCQTGEKSAEIHRLKKLLGYMFARSRRGRAQALLMPTARPSDRRQRNAGRLGPRVAYPKWWLQQPKFRWAAYASASGFTVCLLFLGLSSDSEGQGRKLGSLVRGGRPSAIQARETRASGWELRKSVTVVHEKSPEARRPAGAPNATAETVTRRATTPITMIQGGRKTTVFVSPEPNASWAIPGQLAR